MAWYKHDRAGAEAGVQWVISNRGVTFRQAAEKFNVPVRSIKSRIIYRYGSLAEARQAASTSRRVAATKKTWGRPCICCGCIKPRRYGIYRCNTCTKQLDEAHEGAV